MLSAGTLEDPTKRMQYHSDSMSIMVVPAILESMNGGTTSSRSGAYHIEGNYEVRFHYGAFSFEVYGCQSRNISVEYHDHFDNRQQSMPNKVGALVMTSLKSN